MWEKYRTFKSDWCIPRKVVNIHLENDTPSVEKIAKNVQSKKRKKTISSLRKTNSSPRVRKEQRKREKNIKKAGKKTRCVKKLVRSKMRIKRKQETRVVGKVTRNALNAKASKRVAELAEPKVVQTKKSRDPFKVSPSALKAICSPRTEMLAKPKDLENYAERLHNGITRQS